MQDQPRQLQPGDVVQVQFDENLPLEIVGTLGYVMDATTSASVLIRIYVPKTIGANAEFSEHYVPAIDLHFVGLVPPTMQPL